MPRAATTCLRALRRASKGMAVGVPAHLIMAFKLCQNVTSGSDVAPTWHQRLNLDRASAKNDWKLFPGRAIRR